MIKCPKCGKEVDEWENECPYCKTSNKCSNIKIK